MQQAARIPPRMLHVDTSGYSDVIMATSKTYRLRRPHYRIIDRNSAHFMHSMRPAGSLGVIFDNQLSKTTHVTAHCRSGYFQLRQLRPVVRSLTTEAAKTVVQAFVCCRLDYCNSLQYGESDGLTQKLQSVQNAAARFVTGSRRCDHISHLLVQLHWLPVRRRVEYKVVCLVHQSLSGQAPTYLTDDINLVADSGHHLLRSAVDKTCVVPRTHNTYGDKSFTAAGSHVWNSLPSNLRRDISYGQFRRTL